MNQLMVETRTRSIRSLFEASTGLVHPISQEISSIACTDGIRSAIEQTYRVVKFIVKVRLMEKRVKSQVGRVMVVKVMIQ